MFNLSQIYLLADICSFMTVKVSTSSGSRQQRRSVFESMKNRINYVKQQTTVDQVEKLKEQAGLTKKRDVPQVGVSYDTLFAAGQQ